MKKEKNNFDEKALIKTGDELVEIVRFLFNDNKLINCETIDWKKVFFLAKKHMIAAILFKTVKKYCQDETVLMDWQNYMNKVLRKSILFDAEREKILQELKEKNITYLSLKGIIIKNFYPQPMLREFSDNDILFHEQDEKAIHDIMIENGYSFKKEDNVNAYYKDPVFNFEWHKTLFIQPSPFYNYFSSIWDRVEKDEDENMKMTEEDFYIYSLCHFYKHYKNSGAGLRSFIDYYLLKNKINDNFDWEYTNKILKELNLLDFEEEIDSINDFIFNGKKLDNTQKIYIYSCGAYGCQRNKIQNIIKKKGKVNYIFSRLFLPYRDMVQLFSFLKYIPILLPFCWIIRIIQLFFKFDRRKAIKEEINCIKNLPKK